MKSAVILAAGIGSRLRPLTDKQPKCTVLINEESLISRIVKQLISINKEISIYIAIGYLADKIIQELKDFRKNITFVVNQDYQTTNNMESCRMALEHLKDSQDPSLIINADCIYDFEIVKLAYDSSNNGICCDSSIYNDESMKIRLKHERVTDISKKIKNDPSVATSIDLYTLNSQALKALHTIMESYHQSGDLNQWTEVAIQELLTSHCFNALDISGKKWVEIDNHADLAYAKSIFKK